jgi:hypothetical protein
VSGGQFLKKRLHLLLCPVITAPADASSELVWLYRSILCHFQENPQQVASIHGNLVGNRVIPPIPQVFGKDDPHILLVSYYTERRRVIILLI